MNNREILIGQDWMKADSCGILHWHTVESLFGRQSRLLQTFCQQIKMFKINKQFKPGQLVCLMPNVRNARRCGYTADCRFVRVTPNTPLLMLQCKDVMLLGEWYVVVLAGEEKLVVHGPSLIPWPLH